VNKELYKETNDIDMVRAIIARGSLTPSELAQYLGTSLVSVVRWERGDTRPNSTMRAKLSEILDRIECGNKIELNAAASSHVFASRGVRRNVRKISKQAYIDFTNVTRPPILSRLKRGEFWGGGEADLADILSVNNKAARTISSPPTESISAGKNTYTYDAHTYHTKVPPQGIAEVLRKYLPDGGLIIDPFAGSGMTGVAARAIGIDAILNELSPAASFISERFTQGYDPEVFSAGVDAVCDALSQLRKELYTTHCRTCGKDTEILYTVWSYRVCCNSCDHEFILWDHCRSYGKTVREHKILKEFPCPCCNKLIKKSRLRRTTVEPVLLGYKCCSKYQVEHTLTEDDRERLDKLETSPPLAYGFFPTTELPDGANLGQPKRHGLTSIDRFYTTRNLAAMSGLWRQIHLLKDDELAGFMSFVFTSLYQRVTRLSEYRFWGGSGNTANFNVPYIFNEANVFVTFERKARTIQDHLESTAKSYKGRTVVRTGSATDLWFLPDNSIDLVFTDPPFGANINYSEMNIIWESWFGEFTDNENEVIVNKFQNKDVERYGQLMTNSLRECYRVLRHGHWMLLVFMNSSHDVWQSLRDAVVDSGFTIERVDIFDKQHGTFKQFVSDNTAGCDLLLHCRKPEIVKHENKALEINIGDNAVHDFLIGRINAIPMLPYIHVNRDEEVDYRMLYSEFVAKQLIDTGKFTDFASFRNMASSLIEQHRKDK
jgi:DNA modification methylase/transcriptional regulator with XRE-family HTH domain